MIREFGWPITSASQLKATLGEWLRLCIIPVLILSVIGWCVCAAGFQNPSNPTKLPFWNLGHFFIAPLLYLAVLLHAGCSGDASTMSGIFWLPFSQHFLRLEYAGFYGCCLHPHKILPLSAITFNVYCGSGSSRDTQQKSRFGCTWWCSLFILLDLYSCILVFLSPERIRGQFSESQGVIKEQ